MTDCSTKWMNSLEWFYDLIIDRQFWFEENSNLIKSISARKHEILYNIYFHPKLLLQLSIINTPSKSRLIEIEKLLQIFFALVETYYGTGTDILSGLPLPSVQPKKAERPRKKLPVKIPPPQKEPHQVLEAQLKYSFIHIPDN